MTLTCIHLMKYCINPIYAIINIYYNMHYMSLLILLLVLHFVLVITLIAYTIFRCNPVMINATLLKACMHVCSCQAAVHASLCSWSNDIVILVT